MPIATGGLGRGAAQGVTGDSTMEVDILVAQKKNMGVPSCRGDPSNMVVSLASL